MKKTREALGAELQATVFQSLDDEAFEQLEETLIYADVGAPTTAKIVERLETEADSGQLEGGEDLSRRLQELLADTARVDGDTISLDEQPTVILVVGVNGSGKTTTIGKIAWHLQQELGRSVLLAAGDTYRAAAAEQLALWAERAGCEVVRGEPGSDPGAVVFDAIEAAKARGHDVVIADTAGRLHTQQHLMDELRKVRKVIAGPGAGRAARDAAHHRRHHRPERPAPGAAVPRGGGRDRHRADQARRDRQGRHRAGHRPGARACR